MIGEVGSVLGRHGINIASFALGRGQGGAVGVVTLDHEGRSDSADASALEELRKVSAIRQVKLVILGQAGV